MNRNVILGSMMLLMAGTAAVALSHVKRKRRFKVRPLNRNKKFNVYRNLLQYAKSHDHEQFFKYTRMSPEMFDHLLRYIGPHIERDPTKCPIEPGQRLAITLHYLSEGCSMQEIAWNNYIGKTTVHCIIKETCEVLWSVLAPIVLPEPTTEDLVKISEGFYERWNIPNCIGAVDGKHIVIQCPKNSGSLYFSYKKSFSIILMAACDAYYKFTYIDIGSEGSNHDGHVFQNSTFGRAVLNGTLNVPAPKSLPGTNMVFPYFFVADEAFPLHTNIMRPYPGKYLGERRNIFNFRLSRARRMIENTFGILAQRWRRLRTPIIASEDLCNKIVMACIVLHNNIQKGEEDIPLKERKYCPTGFVDSLSDEDLNLISVGRVGANNSSNSTKDLRDSLADYFISEQGALSHQWNLVHQGGYPDNFNYST